MKKFLLILFFSISLFTLIACKNFKYRLYYSDNIKMYLDNTEQAKNRKYLYNTAVAGEVIVPDGKEIDKLTVDGTEHAQIRNRFVINVKKGHKIEVTFKDKVSLTYSLDVKDDDRNHTKLNNLIRDNIKVIHLSNGKYALNNKPFDKNNLNNGDTVYLFFINNDTTKKLTKFTIDGKSRQAELHDARAEEQYLDNGVIKTREIEVQVLKFVITGKHEIEYAYETKKYATLTVDDNIIIPKKYFNNHQVTKIIDNKYQFEIGATYDLEFKEITGKMVSKFEVNGEDKTNGISKDLNTYSLEVKEDLNDKALTVTYGDYKDLAEVSLGSNLKFANETINPKRVPAGENYEFVITPPQGKVISKILVNKQDLIPLVKDNKFSYKITQNTKFDLTFAEYKDTQEFKLSIDSNVELLDGLKAGNHKIGTLVRFKLKHPKDSDNKFIDKFRVGSYEITEINPDKDYIYSYFLNSDLSISTTTLNKPSVTIDAANKKNIELLGGVKDGGVIDPNTTIQFKLKDLEEGYQYIVKIGNHEITSSASGEYSYKVEKRSITIKVERQKVKHELTYDQDYLFDFMDTHFYQGTAIEHGTMVKFKILNSTNVKEVKVNGHKITPDNNGVYSFKMEQDSKIEVIKN